MNKSLSTATALCLTFLSHTTTLSMNSTPITTIQAVMGHIDIRPKITNQLSLNDRNDTRLVCKAWAKKNRNWKFMPDSVEKKYDNIKQKRKFTRSSETSILFACTAQNDLNAIQWILSSKSMNAGISIPSFDGKECVVHMLAIHNNKPEIARFLIGAIPKYNTEDWKTHYKSTIVPFPIQQCLETNNNDQDFSFLFYLTAIWFDDIHEFEKIYEPKKVTNKGQTCLIHECLTSNAPECFQIILQCKQTKQIIKNNILNYFKLALNTHQEKLPRLFVNKKLIRINKKLFISDTQRCTILDHYHHNAELKKDHIAINILLKLGAKTSKELRQ